MRNTTLFLTVCFWCFYSFAFAQNPDFCKQLAGLKTLIEKEHFAPKKVNDSLSKGLFNLFIDHLDSKKCFFTQSDVDLFKKDLYQLDDYINKGDCEFIKTYVTQLEKRIANSKSYLNEFSNKELDYSGTDTLNFDVNKDFGYFKDEKKSKKYWSKRVRYKVLTDMIEDTTNLEVLHKNFKIKEPTIKQKVIEKELCLLDEIFNATGGIQQFVEHAFLNAYLNYHDPHSTFFSNSEKNVFEHGLGNNQLSFGITTNKNENGDIVVSHIAPGSPAFKNVNLEVNDIIKSVSSNNTILETYCVSNDDILEFLNDESRQEAIFKIKKSSGLIKDIKLIKSLVENEENSARGYIIKNPSEALNIGYIKIPQFYTDFESSQGLGMANDVAKEVYKLKKDGVNGLIIDLRFNGGGSLKEAMDLSGMFIDRGPLTIMKYKSGETYTLKDSKRGAVFTAPLVVLVNHFSASASELFASVMQDYGRALIVGTSTHGKSSAQVVLPIDQQQDFGFAKLTVERFYRPTGKSHQSLGVMPDIQLPSLYDNFKTEEIHLDYTLPNDSVEVSLAHRTLKGFDITSLSEKSKTRVSQNQDFKLISNINKSILKDYINKKTQYALTLDNVFSDINDYRTLWESFTNKTTTENDNIIIENTAATGKVLKYNPEKNKENMTVIEELSNDAMIIETFYILNDIITNHN